MINVCQESRNFAINMLPNLEPTATTDQFVTRFLHVGLYTRLKNFLTFDLNLGVGFYSSMGLYSRQYGIHIFMHTIFLHHPVHTFCFISTKDNNIQITYDYYFLIRDLETMESNKYNLLLIILISNLADSYSTIQMNS